MKMSVILGLGGGQFSTVRYWLSLEYILRVGVGKGKMIDLILTNSLSGCTLPGTTMVIDSWPVYNTLGELDDSSFMHFIKRISFARNTPTYTGCGIVQVSIKNDALQKAGS